MERSVKKSSRATLVAAAVSILALPACGAADGAASDDGGALNIAVLASSSQNGYNQAVYEGVRKAVEASGQDVELKLLDGQFDSNTQLSQMQNVTSGDDYDGVVVVPNDGVSLAAAFPLSSDVPVVTVLNPIGPDIDTMTPQVDGVVSTVAVSPSAAAEKQAEGVLEHCADIDPCKVVELVGNLSATLDVARKDSYDEVLSTAANIEVVSAVEGQYDRDTSLSAISNVLQAHPDIDVILSNADQQTSGAVIALQNAGIDPASLYLTGGGGTEDAVAAVRAGTWKADYINFPVSMGEAAAEQLLAAIAGEEVTEVVDADALGGDVEPYATAETLATTPDFTGEWNG
ncbi:sugar ABC transporter substrate-binding protein [Paenibacillus sp. TRM 82003]|uniref:sugar ABC transporter substrate-binding protein n=1 Tax=Kineococcus sp. TRM81007 TaxID=2925831 RepID=UPI001F574693|nr:sugar ABC transporter substrate-binding protein [Kineococcus sp. TRM81007]MCI2239037.1 sugar ABC transporter substrate-binding protein [Kineococcus sp. TRM81007]MCI3924457.1 sugar ABC transporter substrate-binding protein [Paenibacillus sp. TRM 82003]